jgi:hypothetical protein
VAAVAGFDKGPLDRSLAGSAASLVQGSTKDRKEGQNGLIILYSMVTKFVLTQNWLKRTL